MISRPGLAIGAGVVLIVVAATAPAGVSGLPIPAWSWLVWCTAILAAAVLFRRAGCDTRETLRRTAWLLPVVAVFVVPAAWLAPSGSRSVVALALLMRAWSAASLAAGLATSLGPSGLARGVRQLRAPDRLSDIFEAMLASLTIVLRQVHGMLRAREARRPGFGAWGSVALAPADTVKGFGRLVAALLLRSLERAEAVEQARRARGGAA